MGIYGIAPRLLVQLECEFSGGERRTIVSDEAWSATIAGPLRSADILDGSSWDARREDPHWCDRPGATVGWGGVAIGADLSPLLVSQLHEPIEPVAVLKPERMTSTGDSTVLDFGQNIAGWCELTASGEEGTPLRLRHAEALDAHGALYRDNLRIAVPGMPGAAQEDTFILRGDDGGERLAPRLTYHGFRFAEVSGQAELVSAQAVVARSAVEEILELTCSDPFVERLLDAVRRTLAGNLVGAPTDCPQRDERLGWSGDTQVIAPTLLALFDASAFLEKWCRDLRDAQTPEGCFPDFAPHPFGPLEPPKSEFYGNPGWADAGVIVPWRIYEATGEPRVLRDAFDSACRWVDYVHARNPTRLWLNRPHAEYGDWLNGDTLVLEGWPREGGAVPKPVYATAFFHRSTSLVASMAEVLGDDAQQRRYAERAASIRQAFIDAYVTEDGTVLGDTQGGYALALAFGLVPDELESAVLERLVAAVRARGTRLTTGIQTTPLLLRELTRRGQVELAYELVFARTIPSWGYMLEQGATTVWERWDAFVPGRGFQNPRMNSLNHFALGAVGEWIVRTIGGIARAAPGYERVVIEPCPGGGVTAATCRLRSERGPIEVAWALEDGTLRLVAELPPGVRGAVRLRTSNGNELLHREIGAGRHSFAAPA
ncbi:MAG: alpha-L-rhamnosidase [Solirubrobacterales bacterium]|nr:alpha-L-rhamnosidase [Solirubrobacterales bacterium]